MDCVLSFNFIVVKLLHILLKLLNLEPHREVVVPLFLPYLLLLEKYYSVLGLTRRCVHHLHRVVDLREAVDVEAVLLL